MKYVIILGLLVKSITLLADTKTLTSVSRDVLTCKKIFNTQNGITKELPHLSGIFSLNNGYIRIYGSADYSVNITGNKVYDSASLPVILFKQENCSSIKVKPRNDSTLFSTSCISDSGLASIFTKVHLSTSKDLSSVTKNKFIVTYSSINSEGFSHIFELRSCK